MSTLTANRAMLCWNPGTDQVKVVPLPDKANESGPYKMTALGCYAHVQKMNFEQRKALVFIEAIHLIIRDECDPMAVHNALLRLAEYRDGCAYDVPGMDGECPYETT